MILPLRQLALATINEIYPPEEYLRIYIDGLLLKIDGKAGAESTVNYSPTIFQ